MRIQGNGKAKVETGAMVPGAADKETGTNPKAFSEKLRETEKRSRADEPAPQAPPATQSMPSLTQSAQTHPEIIPELIIRTTPSLHRNEKLSGADAVPTPPQQAAQADPDPSPGQLAEQRSTPNTSGLDSEGEELALPQAQDAAPDTAQSEQGPVSGKAGEEIPKVSKAGKRSESEEQAAAQAQQATQPLNQFIVKPEVGPAPEREIAQTGSMPVSLPPALRELVQEIYVKSNDARSSEIEIQFSSRTLEDLRVSFKKEDGVVAIRFLTGNENTSKLLAQHLPQLSRALAARDIPAVVSIQNPSRSTWGKRSGPPGRPRKRQ
jgi:hypothetical protein